MISIKNLLIRDTTNNLRLTNNDDDHDDDDDGGGGGGGGGGDIALSCPWRSCQLLLSKLLFIKLPQCGHLRRNFDPQKSIKKPP